MKKIIRKAAFVAAFALAAGYGMYSSQEEVELSELALANIEALARSEFPGITDPNKAYGYQLVNCYDNSGRITGATCVQVEDPKSECRYSSSWGDC